MKLADKLCLDVESSGLSDEAYPVSIGVAGPDKQQWSWMICPLEDWDYWDEFAEDVHGISRETLIEEGRDAFLVCKEMNAIFAGKQLAVDSPWDVEWVNRLFYDTGVKPSFKIVRLTQLYPSNVIQVMDECITNAPWPHDAAGDARMLFDLVGQVEVQFGIN